MSELLNVMEQDKRLWVPSWVKNEEPVDGTAEPDETLIPLNVPTREVQPATEEDLRRIVEEQGQATEPEIARQAGAEPGRVGVQSYTSDHPTHFDFRADVARSINRVQKLFPWLTFANTYFQHPPVYGRKYEFVSVDYWGGGLLNGRYAGYRGKPIGTDLGNRVFNAIFNDRHLPNIYWIIWAGSMWTRGYGWGPAPWGPADSDAGHHLHIHVSYLL